MRKTLLITLTTAFTTLLLTCAPEGDGRIAGGSGAGNPKGRTAFTCKATSPDTALVMTDTSGTVFTVTGACLNIANIKLKFPDSTDMFYIFEAPVTVEDNRISINGPYLVDLLTGTTEPELGEFLIPTGSYDQVMTKLEEVQDQSATGITGYTMTITGTFDYQGVPDRNFTILIQFNQNVVFNSPDSVLVIEDELNELLVLLDVRQWLAGVSLTGLLDQGTLELQPDGSLVIDKTTENRCPGLEIMIRKNITDSGILTRQN